MIYNAFDAALQPLLPGKTVEGPISPEGNRPVYKVLFTFGIFNPAVVYDHLGKIFSALILASFDLCFFLYVKGVELYPRIGKNLGIKVFTNCRFGMMACAILALTYCIKQLLTISLLYSGIVCLYITCDCDRQKQEFRRTNGKCLSWGKAPSKQVEREMSPLYETLMRCKYGRT
uniref:Uncharacterized protein n=1 Tax=Populus trichocarpa TaxID=3694 RepID=A0A2K1Z046_POPTR